MPKVNSLHLSSTNDSAFHLFINVIGTVEVLFKIKVILEMCLHYILRQLFALGFAAYTRSTFSGETF